MQRKQVLFLTDEMFVDFKFPGGVQLCTLEFIDYFHDAGFDVEVFKMKNAVTLKRRIKIRLGIDVYETFDYSIYLEEIAQSIKSKNIKFVAFNQIALSTLAERLRGVVSNDVKFIGLSHGNESGDFLHEKTKSPSFLKAWRLGKLLLKENSLYSNFLDATIVISDHEVGLNQWLGANNIFSLPRKLTPQFIEWQPAIKKVGFVGTLNHLPNYAGVYKTAVELEKNGFEGTLVLVGGPERVGKELAARFSFIEYLGQLDDESLLKEVATWRLFLNPVYWFSRGSSTKLAQGLNWGIPVLTTPAGRRGYRLSDESCVVKDHQPGTFAQAIQKACVDPNYLNELKISAEVNVSKFDSLQVANEMRAFLLEIQH